MYKENFFSLSRKGYVSNDAKGNITLNLKYKYKHAKRANVFPKRQKQLQLS